jgi:hypothetical protein
MVNEGKDSGPGLLNAILKYSSSKSETCQYLTTWMPSTWIRKQMEFLLLNQTKYVFPNSLRLKQLIATKDLDSDEQDGSFY